MCDECIIEVKDPIVTEKDGIVHYKMAPLDPPKVGFCKDAPKIWLRALRVLRADQGMSLEPEQR